MMAAMESLSALLPLLVNPVPWVLLLLLVAVLRKERIGGVLLVLLLWLAGTRPAVELAAGRLEGRHPPPALSALREKGVQVVVALTGGGYRGREGRLSSVLPPASQARFLGALELAGALGPECRIVFSGSAGRRDRDLAVAEVMKDLARVLDPRRQVEAEARSGSTAEHPANVRPLLRGEPFALVTSAVHMPRSVASFRRGGLDPVPWPVDFLVQGGSYRWTDWLPSAENCWKLAVVLREYAAIGLYELRKW